MSARQAPERWAHAVYTCRSRSICQDAGRPANTSRQFTRRASSFSMPSNGVVQTKSVLSSKLKFTPTTMTCTKLMVTCSKQILPVTCFKLPVATSFVSKIEPSSIQQKSHAVQFSSDTSELKLDAATSVDLSETFNRNDYTGCGETVKTFESMPGPRGLPGIGKCFPVQQTRYVH